MKYFINPFSHFSAIDEHQYQNTKHKDPLWLCVQIKHKLAPKAYPPGVGMDFESALAEWEALVG